jgi:hypothetical protein
VKASRRSFCVCVLSWRGGLERVFVCCIGESIMVMVGVFRGFAATGAMFTLYFCLFCGG